MLGVILSSKFIDGTLSAQFGKILPVELPIGNKRLLNYQIDFLNQYCEEILITLPNNYSLNNEYDLTIKHLDENLKLIEVFNSIVNFFNKNDRIFIHYGDSLFQSVKNLDINRNNFFIQNPNLSYLWGKENEEGMVPAGGIIILVEELKLLLSNCPDFQCLCDRIMNYSNIQRFNSFEWLDFGHTLTYYNSRIRFLESRAFNKLQSKKGYIIKSSKDVLKIWSEYNWLKRCKDIFPTNVPYVYDFKIQNQFASYSIEYINHPSLSDIYVFGKMPLPFFIKILEKVKEVIINLREYNFEGARVFSENFMVQKLLDRKQKILLSAEILNLDIQFLDTLISENLNYFSKKNTINLPMHGDLCFSNILFDFSRFEPIMIDPRGYLLAEEGFSMFGPESYDLYKLAHSFVVGYDFLIAGYKSENFFSKVEMQKRLLLFCEIFSCDKEDLIMGLKNLFLSMIPLHEESIERQKSFVFALKVINTL